MMEGSNVAGSPLTTPEHLAGDKTTEIDMTAQSVRRVDNTVDSSAQVSAKRQSLSDYFTIVSSALNHSCSRIGLNSHTETSYLCSSVQVWPLSRTATRTTS